MISQEERFWRAIPLLIVAGALQMTWLAPLHLGAANLDLPFLLALAIALHGGAGRGALAGAGAGYLAGLAAMWHPGSWLASRLVPCVLIGALAPRLGRNLWLTLLAPPLAGALGALLADGFYLLFSPADWNYAYWSAHTPASMLLHGALMWPALGLVRRVVRPRKLLVFS